VWSFVGCGGRGDAAEVSVFEPVGVAFEGDDFGVVDEPVDHGGGGYVVTEGLAPPAEWLVAGDDEAGAFVAGGDELEEQVGGLGLERDVADFVDDQQRVASQPDQLALQPAGVVRLGEAGDPFGGGGEQDPVSGLAGAGSQADGQVGRERPLAPDPRVQFQMELRQELDLEIIDRSTHRVFAYLCMVERDLSYVGVNADIFERHRRRVESFLSRVSPQVLEQFTAAYRRAREDDAESKTHALTTCRRILESVADVVYPARAEPVVDSSGKTRDVGPEKYVNRLWMFVAESTTGSTQSKLLLAMLQDFGSRIDTVYSMTSKGVHANVTQAEVDTCVMQTYLLADEILRIFEDTSKGDSAE
jgi:hypothetical protein